MGKPNPYRFALITIVIGLCLSPLFQNCGNVSLSGKLTLPSEIQGQKVTSFPLPTTQEEKVRVVFFVDMSISMAHGLCPCDIAADADDQPELCSDYNPGFQPNLPPAEAPPGTTLPPNPCGTIGIRTGQGIDPSAWRLKVIKNWIVDMQVAANRPEDIRYLIVPFNGGVIEQGRTDAFDFLPADAASARVDELIEEQSNSVEFYNQLASSLPSPTIQDSAYESLKMATTVPSVRLDILRDKVRAETLALGTARGLFELVYLSDGIPKPRTKHFKKAIRRMWSVVGWGSATTPANCNPDTSLDPRQNYFEDCTCACGQIADNYIDGLIDEAEARNCIARGHFNTGSSIASNNRRCLGDEPLKAGFYSPSGGQPAFSQSPNEILRTMSIIWGNPRENTPSRIARKLGEIKELIESSSSLNSRMSFVLLNPARISSDMRNDRENWMLHAKTQKLANRFHYLTSDAHLFRF